MANFPTHLSVASSGGVIATTVLASSSILDISEFVPAIGFVVLGGLFPDVDSDRSEAIDIVFGLFGAVAAMFSTILAYESLGLFLSLALLGLVYSFVKFVLVIPFRKFTVHRGIFHSVPLGLLVSLVICHVTAWLTDGNNPRAWLYALLFFLGYCIHLALDELYSVDLSNYRIKRSFGSAFKFFGSNHAAYYFVTYALLALAFHQAPSSEELIDYILETEFHLWPSSEFQQSIRGIWD